MVLGERVHQLGESLISISFPSVLSTSFPNPNHLEIRVSLHCRGRPRTQCEQMLSPHPSTAHEGLCVSTRSPETKERQCGANRGGFAPCCLCSS